MNHYKPSWIPVVWTCGECGAWFTEDHNVGSIVDFSEIKVHLKSDDFNMAMNSYYERGKLVLRVTKACRCKACTTEIKYHSIIELSDLDSESRQFRLTKSVICGSDDLALEPQGFVFRGVDIATVLPEILVKWWSEGRKIYVVNPFITAEGWKTLLEVSELIENYSHDVSFAKMAHNPFEIILIQDSQSYGKETPKSLLKDAVKSLADDKTEIERIMSSSGRTSLAEKVQTTVPLTAKDEFASPHHRNAGKFHAKFYAGVGATDAEVVLTSYNLTEFEYLQMETFSYQDRLPKNYVLGEIGKILDDRFMNVNAKI